MNITRDYTLSRRYRQTVSAPGGNRRSGEKKMLFFLRFSTINNLRMSQFTIASFAQLHSFCRTLVNSRPILLSTSHSQRKDTGLRLVETVAKSIIIVTLFEKVKKSNDNYKQQTNLALEVWPAEESLFSSSSFSLLSWARNRFPISVFLLAWNR